MEFPSSSAYIFSDSLKVFGILVTFKIFKVFGFLVTILVLLFEKIMQHLWFGVYYIYTQDICRTNLVRTNQNCQLRQKGGTQPNPNMPNSMMMFTSSVFDWKYIFWSNLVQKPKIACLSWNLEPRLTQICRIQWWCHFSCFRPETEFWGKFTPKNQNC